MTMDAKPRSTDDLTTASDALLARKAEYASEHYFRCERAGARIAADMYLAQREAVIAEQQRRQAGVADDGSASTTLAADTPPTPTKEAPAMTDIKCTYIPRGRYSGTCDKPATVAAMVYRYDATGRNANHQPEGRCAQHAGIEKRRKWSRLELVALTPDIVATITARDSAAAAAAEVRREQQATERKAAEARAAERAAREQAVAWRVERLDEEEIDWGHVAQQADGTRTTRQIPTWYIVSDQPDGVERNPRHYNGGSVQVANEYGQPRLTVRCSSSLTPSQAGAMASAIQRALAVQAGEEDWPDA